MFNCLSVGNHDRQLFYERLPGSALYDTPLPYPCAEPLNRCGFVRRIAPEAENVRYIALQDIAELIDCCGAERQIVTKAVDVSRRDPVIRNQRILCFSGIFKFIPERLISYHGLCSFKRLDFCRFG